MFNIFVPTLRKHEASFACMYVICIPIRYARRCHCVKVYPYRTRVCSRICKYLPVCTVWTKAMFAADTCTPARTIRECAAFFISICRYMYECIHTDSIASFSFLCVLLSCPHIGYVPPYMVSYHASITSAHHGIKTVFPTYARTVVEIKGYTNTIDWKLPCSKYLHGLRCFTAWAGLSIIRM